MAALLLCLSCARSFDVVGTRFHQDDNFENISFSWRLRSSAKSDIFQQSYRIRVAQSREALRKDYGLVWDSGKTDSPQMLYVPYGGPAIESATRYYYDITVWNSDGKTALSKTGSWISGLREEDWQAEWIGIDDPGNLTSKPSTHICLSSRYLRKDFTVSKKVKEAFLYVCGLGSSYCCINSEKISGDVFGPLPTFFPKACNYLIYDVTRMLDKGGNTLGIVLGNGRYTGVEIPHGRRSNTSFGLPRAIARLVIRYADGSSEAIVTDAGWKATNEGPITFNNEYDGEYYDATKDLGGWCSYGYKEDSRWKDADIMDNPTACLRAQNAPCLQVQEHLKPQRIYSTPDGRTIVDMGQNMVGWVKLDFDAKAGAAVELRFSEILDREDSCRIDQRNLRLSDVMDRYIPARDGRTVWEPSFAYHGFRYVEIKGLDYTPSAEDISGEVLYDRMATIGDFECSDALLTQIFKNVAWGVKGNYRGMPTDCPQRNEKVGWTGDHFYLSEAWLFDCEYMYNKWSLDLEEAMREDGCNCNVSPAYWGNWHGDISYSHSLFHVPYMLYHRFGNAQVIRGRYPAIKKYIEYALANHYKEGLMVFDRYGDWCSPSEDPLVIKAADLNRETDPCVIANCVFYRELKAMEEFAGILGLQEDEARWASLAREIRLTFNERCYNPETATYGNASTVPLTKGYDTRNFLCFERDGSITGNLTVAGLLALQYGLVPSENAEAVAKAAREYLGSFWKDHAFFGEIGARVAMRGLSRFCSPDLALKVATQTGYPSWGYMIKNGATTIWELWNGDTASVKMNSHNHVMQTGDVVDWMFEDLGGIKATEPGFASIEISPSIPQGLDWVRCSYDSPYGKIESSWKKNGTSVEYEIIVPCGAKAVLRCCDGTVKVLHQGRNNIISD